MEVYQYPILAVFSERLIPVAQDEIMPALPVVHAQLPNDEQARWKTVIPVVDELKARAKKLGLWNLFLSKTHYAEGVPLTNLEACRSRGLPVCERQLTAFISTPSWQRSSVGAVSLLPRPLTALHRIPEIWVRPDKISQDLMAHVHLEVLARYGTEAQKKEWLAPLLDGKIRSAFSMTERFGK